MKEWYVLRTKPKKESSSAALLTRAGIEIYLPRLSSRRGDGATSSEPFFPGYFFGRLDPSVGEIRLASFTLGVLYVLGYGGTPTPVPDDLVVTIRGRIAERNDQAARSVYRRDERLTITRGPLHGVEAIFDRHLTGNGRVRVLIEMLGRLCPAEVAISELQRAS